VYNVGIKISLSLFLEKMKQQEKAKEKAFKDASDEEKISRLNYCLANNDWYW
jgi:hypothetical protein